MARGLCIAQWLTDLVMSTAACVDLVVVLVGRREAGCVKTCLHDPLCVLLTLISKGLITYSDGSIWWGKSKLFRLTTCVQMSQTRAADKDLKAAFHQMTGMMDELKAAMESGFNGMEAKQIKLERKLQRKGVISVDIDQDCKYACSESSWYAPDDAVPYDTPPGLDDAKVRS